MIPVRFSAEQENLLRDLFQAGAVVMGDAVRARFGLNTPIYFNLREALCDHPELLWKIGREFTLKIGEFTRENPLPQCVVGIPDTGTPLAVATALFARQQGTEPKISYAMLRKEGKAYPGFAASYWIGKKDITPCEYNLLDDVVASGLTKRLAAARMREEGIRLRRILVLFDREQGDGLRNEGYELRGVFPVSAVMDFYRIEELIAPADHQKITEFLASRRYDAVPGLK
ncbi:MAG: hypothetical protein HY648_06215 [Acidobacteria bacterium]|nr:hypothetical protein [Acidobacteriota bacterium]